MQDMCSLRYKSHQSLDNYLKRQESVRKINYTNNTWVWARWQKPITETSKANCHLLLDEVLKINSDYKITISGDNAHLYTNQINDLKPVCESTGVTVVDIKRAVVDVPEGTMFFSKPPAHKIRTYFKTQKIDGDEKDKLFKFLQNYKDIRLSPCMEEWITVFPHNTYIMNNYFIDYNNEGFLTMLRLASNIKIKETLSLHSR
jgi:hypothetical protein